MEIKPSPLWFVFREISLFLKELVLGFEKLFWFLKLTCVLGNHFVFLEIDLIINVKLDKSVKKKNKFKLNIQTQKSNIMGSN